jgi:CO/xanthine dehydrogenase FAD-binding subunit
MKPVSFEYARPADLEQACAMLAAGDDTRIIAGGQTLVPLMAMRLARPKRLIDIARITDLAFVRHERDGISIGATTRQCVLERDAVVRAAVPLLARVIPFVGHAAIRSRGTIGGSLANADPAAEIALVAVTLGATLLYREGTANGEIGASDFFIGPMMTALPAAGCMTAVRFPLWRDARIGVGFHEVSPRRSDFAFASAAAQIEFAVQADGYAITTIEGVAQDAFCETHGMQCGYCTPAMILTAHALLADNPAPTRAQIVDAISANICRCTGYAQIVEAIALAAERMRGLNQPVRGP